MQSIYSAGCNGGSKICLLHTVIRLVLPHFIEIKLCSQVSTYITKKHICLNREIIINVSIFCFSILSFSLFSFPELNMLKTFILQVVLVLRNAHYELTFNMLGLRATYLPQNAKTLNFEAKGGRWVKKRESGIS